MPTFDNNNINNDFWNSLYQRERARTLPISPENNNITYTTTTTGSSTPWGSSNLLNWMYADILP